MISDIYGSNYFYKVGIIMLSNKRKNKSKKGMESNIQLFYAVGEVFESFFQYINGFTNLVDLNNTEFFYQMCIPLHAIMFP